MYIGPFWWAFLLTVKEFSFSCICSINNKELGIRLTSGRPQTTVNKRSGSKNKVAPVNFKADILWNTDHYYYYGLLCRMLSVPNTFRNFILQFFNLYLMTFSSTLLNWRCAVLLTVSIACCFSDVKYRPGTPKTLPQTAADGYGCNLSVRERPVRTQKLLFINPPIMCLQIRSC